MRRLSLALLLFLLSGLPALAAARVGSVDGLWSATATWGGSAVPTTADDVTINAGIEVICDAATCSAFSIAANGLLFMKAGTRTLVVGNASATAGAGNITVGTAGGVYGYAGHTLEFDVDRSGETANAVVTNNGTLIWTGDVVRRGGKISAAAAMTGNVPDRKIVLTDSLLVQPSVDYYSGKYLRPTSGYFRGHFFTITTGGATTRDIAVLMDDRGALDSRNKAGRVSPTAWAPGDWGQTYYRANASADGAIVSAGTTVTFSAGIFASQAVAEDNLLGSRFVCETDLNAVDDTNIGRFCSVASATVATLCATYTGATCTGAADDGFHVFDDNQPPYAVVLREEFREGDTYEIIDPAKMTIASANRSNVNQDDQYNLLLNSGSTSRLENILLDYCGQQRTGGSDVRSSCVEAVNIDNSMDSEQFYISLADLWHFSGEGAIHLTDSQNIEIANVSIHDAAEGGDSTLNHEAHGIFTEDSATVGRISGMKFHHNRITRTNDSAIVLGNSDGEGTDGIACTDCKAYDNFIGFAPANDGGSVDGIIVQSGIARGSSFIRNNFITNMQTFGIKNPAPTTLGDVVLPSQLAIVGNLVLNSAEIGIQSNDVVAATGLTDTYMKNVVAGNAVIAFGYSGIQRGYVYDNYLSKMNVSPNTTVAPIWYGQAAIGNVILGGRESPNGSADCYLATPTTAGLAALLPVNVSLKDNTCLQALTHGASGTQNAFTVNANSISGVTWTLDHNTFYCNEDSTTVNNATAINAAPAISQTIVVKNSIFVDCSQSINEPAAGAGGDTTSASNLRLNQNSADSGVTALAGDLTTGTINFRAQPIGDLSVLEGSTPWTSLGDDSAVRGARVAGPANLQIFRVLYPFIDGMVDTFGNAVPAPFNANTIGNGDGDGDGIFDIHDTCDTNADPLAASCE